MKKILSFSKIQIAMILISLLVIFYFIFNNKTKEIPIINNSKLDLFFTCDIDGRIEPCGCFSGQLGGLTKIKTMIESATPSSRIILDAGNAIAGQEDYHVIQYAYILKTFQSIHYNAINIGHKEALLPLPSLLKLKQLSENNSIPILSANLKKNSDQKTIFDPYTIIKKGSKKIGVIGIVSSQLEKGSLDKEIYIQEPRLALAEIVAELDKKVDVIILLGFLSTQEMTKIAEEFYEIDFILGGNVRESSTQLVKENQSWVYYTTNEGRTLGKISFELTPKVKILDNSISLAFENIYDDDQIKDLSTNYRNEIRKTKLSVDLVNENDNMIPGVSNLNYYVGSEKCSACHADEYETWKGSSHAKAFHSLQNKNSDADPTCIKCHTVGFGSESGYKRIFQAEKLINVGCENCHGPAGIHVDELKAKSKRIFKFNEVTESECRKCHYGEFSKPFDWNTFWPKVKHGKNNK